MEAFVAELVVVDVVAERASVVVEMVFVVVVRAFAAVVDS